MNGLFSGDYLQARRRFLDAARDAGARLSSYDNDGASERLHTDVAWLGPRSAARVLVTVSGTHGVEGYTGSACQLRLLTGGLLARLPAGTALLLVHALNPYGFAHDRRVNEDNVDLNRNFVDHERPPANDGYPQVHPFLVPPSWEGPERVAADEALMAVAAERGVRYLQSVITAGQWTHPDGLFHGGTRPVWSHRVLEDVTRSHLTGREQVAYVDLHTGLGERAVGEPIFRGGRDRDALERARRWYGGALTTSEHGTSSSTPIVGNTATLLADVLCGGEQLTAITLEFGTLPGIEVLAALRADNWLALQPEGTVAPELHRLIKRQIRAAFYPDEADWRDAVLARADTVLAQTLTGLTTNGLGTT